MKISDDLYSNFIKKQYAFTVDLGHSYLTVKRQVGLQEEVHRIALRTGNFAREIHLSDLEMYSVDEGNLAYFLGLDHKDASFKNKTPQELGRLFKAKVEVLNQKEAPISEWEECNLTTADQDDADKRSKTSHASALSFLDEEQAPITFAVKMSDKGQKRLIPFPQLGSEQADRGVAISTSCINYRKIQLSDGQIYKVNPQSLDIFLGLTKGTLIKGNYTQVELGKFFEQKMKRLLPSPKPSAPTLDMIIAYKKEMLAKELERVKKRIASEAAPLWREHPSDPNSKFCKRNESKVKAYINQKLTKLREFEAKELAEIRQLEEQLWDIQEPTWRDKLQAKKRAKQFKSVFKMITTGVATTAFAALTVATAYYYGAFNTKPEPLSVFGMLSSYYQILTSGLDSQTLWSHIL